LLFDKAAVGRRRRRETEETARIKHTAGQPARWLAGRERLVLSWDSWHRQETLLGAWYCLRTPGVARERLV